MFLVCIASLAGIMDGFILVRAKIFRIDGSSIYNIYAHIHTIAMNCKLILTIMANKDFFLMYY